MEVLWIIIFLMYVILLLLVEVGYFNGGLGLNEFVIFLEIVFIRVCFVIGNLDILL